MFISRVRQVIKIMIKNKSMSLLRMCVLGLLMLPFFLSAQVSLVPEQIAYDLSTRYTPYADSGASLNAEQLARLESHAWWRSPAAIRADRSPDALPLAGLHLALDPGHIGGIWAEWEWRHFRIAESDHWVREGELVLEVARCVRARLHALGAEVTLLRESHQPINPKTFEHYWAQAAAGLTAPAEASLHAQLDHALAVRNRAIWLAIVSGEIAARARLVNEVIQPDALISLHINAAPWPAGETQQLVESDHAHVLIFGCLSAGELASPSQQARLVQKMTNGSGAVEAALGAALGQALAEATALPASDYEGDNAIRIDPEVPHLWARNLMLLRLVDCPTVLMEPYIANSQSSYARIQKALALRAVKAPVRSDDILIEYAHAVVEGILQAYGLE